MKWLLWLFSQKNTPVKISFLLCTILLDLATIITYTAWKVSIHPVALCSLLVANIISTLGTILSQSFSVVPDVYGYKYKTAAEMLKKEGVTCSVICEDVVIIEQKPAAGEVVRKGTKIKLTVGKATVDGPLKKVNVAFDEISEELIDRFRVSLAMAGQPNSINKKMIITEADCSEKSVEVVFSFEFMDSGHEFIVYCDGQYEDGTPKLCFNRLINGKLVDIDDEDWKQIRVLMRYVGYAKEPLEETRIGKDGIEILC